MNSGLPRSETSASSVERIHKISKVDVDYRDSTGLLDVRTPAQVVSMSASGVLANKANNACFTSPISSIAPYYVMKRGRESQEADEDKKSPPD